MAKSIPLSFEMVDDHGRTFLVSFESESPLRNTLMEVIYQNLPLHFAYIVDYDKELYNNILNLMKSTAKDYWTNKLVCLN